MQKNFKKYFTYVGAVHVGLLCILFFFAWVKGCSHKEKDITVPVEFLVKVPSVQASQEVIANDVVPEIPDKAPSPPVKLKPKKPPKIVKKTPIHKGAKITKKLTSNADNKKRLSDDEIRKLLEEGAKPSNRTVIPDEDTRSILMIKRKLQSAWIPPSSEVAGASMPVVSIRLNAGGVVYDRKLVKPSGNKVLDESVMRALVMVKRINGISESFIRRNLAEDLKMTFEVE